MLLIIPLVSATVSANEPPSVPTIDGPTSGEAGVLQTYTFTSTDPEEHDISYCVEWGCGESEWSDFTPSGAPVSLSHTYAAGDYVIRAKAMDTGQAESDWAELPITMPRNRLVANLFFFRILQHFPNAFPILRYILGL